jgi:hypothetical protein
MELTIYKVYNRVVHSYLAVFETSVAPTADADPNIFVCKDLPDNPPIPPAPPIPEESSSADSSESSLVGEGSSTASGGSSIQEEASSDIEDSSVSLEEGSSLSEGSEGTSSEPSTSEPSIPGEASSDIEDSSVSLEEGSSSEVPLFTIFPQRTLVSIASLTDLMVLPLTPAAQGDLYRTSTVAMIFRSKSHMNNIVAEVVAEVGINADMQRVPIDFTEVIELQDPVYGQDNDSIFYFR